MQGCVKHKSCCIPWFPGSSLVLCTDMHPWIWMSFCQPAEWAPVSRQQILAATRSHGPKFIKKKFRAFLCNAISALCCCFRFSRGSVSRLWSATLEPCNGEGESRLLFSCCLCETVRWCWRLDGSSAKDWMSSFQFQICGLPVVKDCCHKNVCGFSFTISVGIILFLCEKGDNYNKAKNNFVIYKPFFKNLKEHMVASREQSTVDFPISNTTSPEVHNVTVICF